MGSKVNNVGHLTFTETATRILTTPSDSPDADHKERRMKLETFKPKVIALVAVAVAATASAASAATRLATSGCCPLCK